MAKTVAVIVGSLRKESFSRKLAKALGGLASDGLSLKIVEIGELDRAKHLCERLLGFASPLSLPYLIDATVPALAAASDDDPATSVPTVG